jgi:MoaA/NifB/PqqE/SkfB family radical SAM enzyme
MPSRTVQELDFSQAKRLIETLSSKGARFLSLTGGEPLLREDIGKIVDAAHSRSMRVKINSNGLLFPQKADELKNLSALVLSYDGPEQAHDHLRGAGSHRQVMRAVEAAHLRNIPVSFCTVLSEANIDRIEDILTVTENMKVRVMFQPATQTLYGGHRPNPVASSIEKYKKALFYLQEEKKKGNPFILNSPGGLKWLARWPEPTEIRCANGLLGCRIEPDGEVRLCSLTDRVQSKTSNLRNDFERSFESLLLDVKCRDCWCAGQIEMNQMTRLKPDAIMNAFHVFR